MTTQFTGRIDNGLLAKLRAISKEQHSSLNFTISSLVRDGLQKKAKAGELRQLIIEISATVSELKIQYPGLYARIMQEVKS